MSRTSILYLFWLAAVLSLLMGLEGVAPAQTDYQHVWRYFPTDNTFCTSGPNCWFLETDTITAATTNTQIQVWTSFQVGSALFANYPPYSAAQTASDSTFPVYGNWNEITGVTGQNPTNPSRAPDSGNLTSPMTAGTYHALLSTATWGHESILTTERYLGSEQDLKNAVNDVLVFE